MTTREEDLVALSALMDGETQDLELRRLLGSAESDPELRARWRRQQLVRDVLHDRRGGLPQFDVSAGVQQAISDQPRLSQNPLWSMAVAASVTIVVVLGGQTLMPAEQVVPRALVSQLGGNVVPVSGALPVRASLETGAVPLTNKKVAREDVRKPEVAAIYERWAHERYQLLSEHHAAVSNQNHPVPYIARMRIEGAPDIPVPSE